jgi:hypothetical protein
MRSRRFSYSGWTADQNCSINAQAIFPWFLEAFLVEFWPGFEPCTELFDVALVAADFLDVRRRVLGRPELR